MSETRESETPAKPEGMSAFHAAIRLAIEIAGLAGLGLWGWHLGASRVSGMLLTATFVLAAASIWAVFGVVNEPGRGNAIVPVAGWMRLTIEIALFVISAYGVWTSWSRAAAETLLTVVALHYAVTWERCWWLLRGSRINVDEKE